MLSLHVLSQVILIKPTYVPDFNKKEIIKTEGATISRAKMERGDDGFICGLFSEGYLSIQYSNALLAPPLKRPAMSQQQPTEAGAGREQRHNAPALDQQVPAFLPAELSTPFQLW